MSSSLTSNEYATETLGVAKVDTKITSAKPGSAQGPYLIVSDIDAARNELVARGAELGEVFHPETPGVQFEPNSTSGRVRGPAPDHMSYRSFATFNDPDGNGWLLQEVLARDRGRTPEEGAEDAALHIKSSRQ